MVINAKDESETEREKEKEKQCKYICEKANQMPNNKSKFINN